MVSVSLSHQTPLSETHHSTPKRFRCLYFCLEAENQRWLEGIVLETMEQQRGRCSPWAARAKVLPAAPPWRSPQTPSQPLPHEMHSPGSSATIKDSGVRSGRGGGSSSSGCGGVANWGDTDTLPTWHNPAGEPVQRLRADGSYPALHLRRWLITSKLWFPRVSIRSG